MIARITVLSVALIGVVPVAMADAGVDIQPGKWEIRHTMDMQGSSISVPPMTREQCITAKDVAKGNEQLTHPEARPGQTCHMNDHSHTGNTYTLDMTCSENGDTSHVKGKVVFDSRTAYHGEFHMTGTSQGHTMHMTEHVSAKRIGDCK